MAELDDEIAEAEAWIEEMRRFSAEIPNDAQVPMRGSELKSILNKIISSTESITDLLRKFNHPTTH